MRELELIAQLGEVFGHGGARVIRSIGDDAAIVRAGRYAVTSLDTMVEGVHFRRGELTDQEIGHRALAGALSDLAAMAAVPGEAYLALGVPEGIEADAVRELARGAQALAAGHGVTIAGGDVTRAPALTMSFTVVGWAHEAGVLVGRDGAQIGDRVCVSGALGAAGAGLAVVESRAGRGLAPERRTALRERYARPAPRFALGRLLAARGARALIDLSDGLASDAAQIAQASGVRIELRLASLPLADGVREVAGELGVDAHAFAATAGEDYELCVCLPAAEAQALCAVGATAGAGATLTEIGAVVDGAPGVSFLDYEGQLSGYEHRF